MKWKIFKDCGDYSEVQSERGDITLISKEDLDFFFTKDWHIDKKYLCCDIQANYIKKRYYLHRLLMKPPDDMLVDHINRDRRDNRRANLRICSKMENTQNRGGNYNKILPKGVRRRKAGWEVRVMLRGKMNQIGMFTDLNAAINAYNYFALKFHGEFACLNEVDKFMEREEWDSYRSKSVCRYYGVTYEHRTDKWYAKSGKHLGTFLTQESAARAYNDFIIRNNLNKPLNDFSDPNFNRNDLRI
jgi:hypothetical protein